MIIAIDGPVGAGKSTVARLLAKKLGFTHLDTGAIYRAITVAVIRRGVEVGRTDEVALAARESEIRFGLGGDSVFLNGEDVSREIRTPMVDGLVPDVAKIPEVRAEVVKKQRAIAAEGGVVAEGRDIGSVVFPDADLKFYLDAAPEERGRRRYRELRGRGVACSLPEIIAEVKERDRKDLTREHSPLQKADDAVLVDTTGKPIEAVVQEILNQVNAKKGDVA